MPKGTWIVGQRIISAPSLGLEARDGKPIALGGDAASSNVPSRTTRSAQCPYKDHERRG